MLESLPKMGMKPILKEANASKESCNAVLYLYSYSVKTKQAVCVICYTLAKKRLCHVHAPTPSVIQQEPCCPAFRQTNKEAMSVLATFGSFFDKMNCHQWRIIYHS